MIETEPDKLVRLTLTAAQAVTLHKRWERWSIECANGACDPLPGDGSFADFLRECTTAMGGECIMFYWAGMWVGVEKDGYAHT